MQTGSLDYRDPHNIAGKSFLLRLRERRRRMTHFQRCMRTLMERIWRFDANVLSVWFNFGGDRNQRTERPFTHPAASISAKILFTFPRGHDREKPKPRRTESVGHAGSVIAQNRGHCSAVRGCLPLSFSHNPGMMFPDPCWSHKRPAKPCERIHSSAGTSSIAFEHR